MTAALRWAALDTPLGRMVVVGGGRGLVAVHLPNALPAGLDLLRRDEDALADGLAELEEYFAGRRRAFDLPLAPAVGSLDRSIREALQAIPYGETASYGEVEDLIVRLGADTYPPITGLLVAVARRRAYVPAERVADVEVGGVALGSSKLDLREFSRRPDEVLLRKDVLDRQLINVDGA